jgi:hypothetical protein
MQILLVQNYNIVVRQDAPLDMKVQMIFLESIYTRKLIQILTKQEVLRLPLLKILPVTSQ